MYRSVIVLVLVMSACASSAGGIELDASADGTSLSLTVGDRVEISLAGNPTTGYTWQVASIDEAILSIEGDPSFRADSTLVGAGGTMTLAFDTIGPGTTTLELAYLRPFESVPPEATFTVTFVVTG